MQRIVCYGDSNTWGYVAGIGTRLPEDQRWPAILQEKLGADFEVIEAGVCGRTIALDDPDVDGRNGLKSLATELESAGHFSHLIVMLGTNDTKCFFHQTTDSIKNAMRQLLQQAFQYQSKFSFSTLLISPAPLNAGIEQSPLKHLFDHDSRELSLSLADAYRDLAQELHISFLDAGIIATPSQADCVHLTIQSHQALADTLSTLINQ